MPRQRRQLTPFRGAGSRPMPVATIRRAVFWGDQHVHTGWSADAGAFGATLGPEEALRFARGEEVMSSLGLPAKLSRPLDWAAITDHSDAAGVIFEIRDGNPNLMADPQVKRWHDMMAAGQGVEAASEMIAAQSNNKIPPAMKDPRLAMTVWEKNTAIMEKYNEPGRVHRLHRLRVDEQRRRRRQSAPQRDLSRRQGKGRPGPADDDLRQREPRGSLDVDGGVGGEDRRLAAGHSP